MNYIYDIYANLNKKYYDVYDWEKKDKIIHIKKIPIFKIRNSDLQQIIKNEIKVDIELYKLIKNKTTFFDVSKNICLCVFTDSRDEILVQINKNGNIIRKSSIHFTDTYNNFNVIKNLNLTEISYQIIDVCQIDLLSRKDVEKKIFLIQNIDVLNKQKLTYLYFECFNKKIDDYKLIKNLMIKEILNNNEKVCSTIYNFLKLIYASS